MQTFALFWISGAGGRSTGVCTWDDQPEAGEQAGIFGPLTGFCPSNEFVCDLKITGSG